MFPDLLPHVPGNLAHMSQPIISIENLGKRYRIHHDRAEGYTTLRDVITRTVKGLFTSKSGNRNSQSSDEDFWALKGVSFEVQPGEVVGIIGRNGAGKSTLLKILSRITESTEGRVTLRGRVASLLEVGTGFHPELTGRENIFLNGAILGMTRAEIRKKFDEIVAFAEVEKFLDTPVKRYSSGMYVRLAFAVAAHLESDVLVIDEVLAVGDASFQKKCLGKMQEVGASGRTVLFVSHNLSAVQRLCTTGVFLDAGRVQTSGPIARVIDAYQRALEPGATRDEKSSAGRPVSILDWEVIGASEGEKHACSTRDVCRMRVRITVAQEFAEVFFGFALWDAQGELMVAGSSYDEDKKYIELSPGTHWLTVTVRLPLKAGLYHVQMSVNTMTKGQITQEWLEPKLHILPLLDTHLPEKWHGLLTEQVGFALE